MTISESRVLGLILKRTTNSNLTLLKHCKITRTSQSHHYSIVERYWILMGWARITPKTFKSITDKTYLYKISLNWTSFMHSQEILEVSMRSLFHREYYQLHTPKHQPQVTIQMVLLAVKISSKIRDSKIWGQIVTDRRFTTTKDRILQMKSSIIRTTCILPNLVQILTSKYLTRVTNHQIQTQ